MNIPRRYLFGGLIASTAIAVCGLILLYAVFLPKHRVEPFKPPQATRLTKGTSKLVLLWTTWFTDDGWDEMFRLNDYSPVWNIDGGSSCVLTTDKSLIEEASAVIFHGSDFYSMVEEPPVRHPWQRWVFFALESPPNNDMTKRLYQRADIMAFNWTMTYQPNADVYFPYGTIVERSSPQPKAENERSATKTKIEQFAKDFSKRPYDALWLVSSCSSNSNREELFQRLLRSGLTIHRFGHCGHQRPEQAWEEMGGVYHFSTRYRYYFSFENSLCDGYVTEKAFAGYYHNLYHGMIPIVYGSANYSQLFPKGSFINALDKHPSELARQLKELSKSSPETIAKFSEWQYTHELQHKINEQNYFKRNYGLKFGWNSLCSRLWTASSSDSKTIHNLRQELGQCYEPPLWYQESVDLKHWLFLEAIFIR